MMPTDGGRQLLTIAAPGGLGNDFDVEAHT